MNSCLMAFLLFLQTFQNETCCTGKYRTGWYMTGDKFGLVTTWISNDKENIIFSITEKFIKNKTRATCVDNGKTYYVNQWTRKSTD